MSYSRNQNRFKKNDNIDKQTSETVTRTFRISSEWDEVLQKEAEKKGISVNVLMNQILRRYVLYTRWTDKADLMNITKPTFTKIINEIPEEALQTVGEDSGPADIFNILNMIGRPVNYDSWGFLVSEFFGGNEFSRWFTCYHHVQGGKDLFHLQHGMGMGWSKFLNEYLINSSKSLIDFNPESKIYPFAVNVIVK